LEKGSQAATIGLGEVSINMSEGLLGNIIVWAAKKCLPGNIVGSLDVTLPSGRMLTLGQRGTGIEADLKLHNFSVVWASIKRAQLGFFERYLAGDVESSDPTKVFKFYLRNRHGLDNASNGVFFASLLDKLWHRNRDNSRAGSRENIAEHYDLGNEFYRLWLDDTMSYSSAVFDSTTNSLEAGQNLKLKKIMEAAEVKPGKEVLEIGCGWGGFAEAAGRTGASVHGITLSREQLAFSQSRMQRVGLARNCTFAFEDYRDTKGTFDSIASVEMIEAVGEAHWPSYFRNLFDRLRPGGVAAIQGITILEKNFAAYKNGVDFIQRYVFPGGMLLTKDIMREQAERAGLLLEKIECFGQSYAQTLRMWHERFESAWPQIAPLGFDERFRRMWKLYLCYCEAGFSEGVIDVGIYKLRKPV
jgi:cyclopropane-fatty-acyl-phospholipid synthase